MNGSTLLLGATTDRAVVGFYLTYAAIAVALVVWLARTLHQNGQVFLEDVFEQPAMARSVNHLLVVGFYLLNLGYALLIYKLPRVTNQSLSLQVNHLVTRLGVLLVSLGVIHLGNMFVFWRIRTHRDRAEAATPPAPSFIPPPPQPAGATQ